MWSEYVSLAVSVTSLLATDPKTEAYYDKIDARMT